jgi:hypothetical protein
LDEEKMKHEFKVTRSKDQTVYTLESASSGGTSSGSVASVSTALGGVQRRPTDSIFAQEAKKEEPKPRNFVAKNAKMGGAGKMKDKSKTIPRHEKHKKPVAEGVAGPEKCWPGHRKVGTQPGTGKNAGKRVNDCEKIKEQGVAEGPNDGKEDNFTIDDIKRLEKIRDLETLKAQAKELIKGKPARRMKPEKISWFYNHIDTLRNPLAVIKMMYDLMLAGEGNKVIGSRNSMSSNSYRTRFGEDHEIQMASSELQSIAKNAEHLLDLVRKYSEQEGLQAWQQSKITKAADYLNSVLQSINGEQSGMEEARNNYHANTTGFGRRPRDDERHDLDTQTDPRETMMWNLTIDGNPLNPEPIMGRSNLIKFGKQQAASGVDLSNAVISPVNSLKERTEVKDKSGKVVSWKDETPWRKAEKNKQGQPKDPRGKVTNLSDKARRETEKNVEEDAYMMELASKLAEKIPPNADVDYYIKDFAKSTAPQFKGKNPAKRKQMAIAAYYGSKQKKK